MQEIWSTIDVVHAGVKEGLIEDDYDFRIWLADRMKMLNRALLVFEGKSLEDALGEIENRNLSLMERRRKDQEEFERRLQEVRDMVDR